MTPDKKKRIAFAAGFVTAVLASVRAIGDATIFWPPAALWQQLRGPQRFQFVGGIVVALVLLVLSVMARTRES